MGADKSGTGDLKGFAARFEGHLVTVEDGKFKPFDSSKLKDVKYFALYYSATWCPPCHVLTPKVVSFYNAFKPKHPNFELIFVTQEYSAKEMLGYMKDQGMKWPAIRYDDVDSAKVDQYATQGIPVLVLLDADGKILSDTFKGSDYRGPEAVLNDIKRIVK